MQGRRLQIQEQKSSLTGVEDYLELIDENPERLDTYIELAKQCFKLYHEYNSPDEFPSDTPTDNTI
jgi:hypothetical protein